MANFVKPTGSQKYKFDPKQKEATYSLIKYIDGDLLPFATVESQNIKNFIEKLNPKFQIPSLKHLSSKLIQTKAKDVCQTLYDNLQKADHICLTVDIWSNRAMQGFLGISAHYI